MTDSETPATNHSVDLPQNQRSLWPWLTALAGGLLAVFHLAGGNAPSQVWRHLAQGRWLVENGYWPAGKDFLYTTGDATWINPSWLFDIKSYLIFHFLGVESLLLLKALAVGVATWLLTKLKRPQVSAVWPCATAMLSLAVVSSKFDLLPDVATWVLWCCCWWILYRLPQFAEGRFPWLLVVCLVVWVNCDPRFFLGAWAIGGWLAGQWWESKWGSSPLSKAQLKRVSLIAVLALAATLINPFGWNVWRMPWLIAASRTPATEALGQTPSELLSFYRAEGWAAWGGSWQGMNWLMWVVLLLLLLASVAVVLNRQHGEASRGGALLPMILWGFLSWNELPWAALGLIWLTSQNLQSWWARRQKNSPAVLAGKKPLWRAGVVPLSAERCKGV